MTNIECMSSNIDEEIKHVPVGEPIPKWIKLCSFPVLFCTYTLFLLVYVTALCSLGILTIRSVQKKRNTPDYILNDLLKYWAGSPLVATLKLREAEEFFLADILEPSMEVGVHTGANSFAVNSHRNLTIGLEYLPDMAVRLPLLDKKGIFRYFVSADATQLPFADDTFQTIMTIHSIDDMQRPADDILREVNRVLHPGGHMIYSLFSRDLRKANPFLEFFLWLFPSFIGDKVRNLWVFGFHNLLDIAQWRSLADKCGFEIEIMKGFICGKGWKLFAVAYRLESFMWNLLDLKSVSWIPSRMRRRLAMYGYDYFRRTDAVTDPVDTMNYFVRLRKKADNEIKGKDVPLLDIGEMLLCIKCRGRDMKRTISPQGGTAFSCSLCGYTYPVINGVVVAHYAGKEEV